MGYSAAELTAMQERGSAWIMRRAIKDNKRYTKVDSISKDPRYKELKSDIIFGVDSYIYLTYLITFLLIGNIILSFYNLFEPLKRLPIINNDER